MKPKDNQHTSNVQNDDKMDNRRQNISADDKTMNRVFKVVKQSFRDLYQHEPDESSDLFKWWVTNTFQMYLTLALYKEKGQNND